jgi:hypothetical protein
VWKKFSMAWITFSMLWKNPQKVFHAMEVPDFFVEAGRTAFTHAARAWGLVEESILSQTDNKTGLQKKTRLGLLFDRLG